MEKVIGTSECEIFARFLDLASSGVARRNETSRGNHGSVSKRICQYLPSKLPANAHRFALTSPDLHKFPLLLRMKVTPPTTAFLGVAVADFALSRLGCK